MANQPHDMEGKTCPSCGRELNKQSFTGSIRYREAGSGMIIYRRACIDCMNKHYGQGE